MYETTTKSATQFAFKLNVFEPIKSKIHIKN